MSIKIKANIIINKGGIIMTENDTAPINYDDLEYEEFSKEDLKEAGVTTDYLSKDKIGKPHEVHRGLNIFMLIVLVFFFLLVVIIGSFRLSSTDSEQSEQILLGIPVILEDV